MSLFKLSKKAAKLSKQEVAPGIPARKITPLPVVRKPAVWEFSAHPHHAKRSGTHTDIRLGNPATGIAHSLVLPRRTALPGPGESALVIPTFDHTIPYMDYFGPISTKYGLGVVERGRRTQAEVYHADPDDAPGTKLRFNLYEGQFPEELALRKDQKGRWFLHNKTQTREGRPDIPAEKAKYKEVDPDKIDVTNDAQALMPKLDGAHAIIDLKAGRAPRAFSYRTAKKAKTGLIEHTHKMPGMLTKKVPKALDGTVLRAEIMGVRGGDSIEFPEEEHVSLRKRLDSGGPIYTTRIKAERGKYAPGQLLDSPFGPLEVEAVKGLGPGEHPFSRQLTRGQRKQLSGEKADLVKLKRAPDAWEKRTKLPAKSVKPLHRVTDRQKLLALKSDMRRRGWVGDPVVVDDDLKGVSGSHRIAAAKSLGIDIPALVVGPSSILKGVTDDDSVLERLANHNLSDAVSLMRRQYPGGEEKAPRPPIGRAIPAEQIGGLLNSKVWASRHAQAELGVRLKAFPFDVVKYKGRSMADAPFVEKLKVLREVERSLADLDLPEIAVTAEEKINLLNRVKSKRHPLTEEGFVLVEKDRASTPIKAKFAPDFDVFVRDVHPAVSGKTGRPHDRAGAISYSWTPDGPIVGQLGGFRHAEARDMLANPDKYVGRVAKVKAMKVFKGEGDQPGALFQPRFKEWHLDKGEIEKSANHEELTASLKRIAAEAGARKSGLVIGGSGILGALGKKQLGDLDVWATRGTFKRLAKHPSAQPSTAVSGSPKLSFDTPEGEIEVFDGPWMTKGKDYAGKRNTEVHRGLKHWNPSKTLDWKRSMNRPKDQPDIKALQGLYKKAALGLRPKVDVFVYDDKGRVFSRKKVTSYAFPGGGLDPGESASAAAKREVLEEVGYKTNRPVQVLRPQTVIWDEKEKPFYGKRVNQFKGNRLYFRAAEAAGRDKSLLGVDDDQWEDGRFVPISQLIRSLKRTAADESNPFRQYDIHKAKALENLQARLEGKGLKKQSSVYSAFLGELEKISYGKPEHTGLSKMTIKGMGMSPTSDVGRLFTRASNAADTGIRHPFLPTSPDTHSMPGRSKRDVAKGAVDARQSAIRDMTKAIRSRNVTGQIRGWRDLATSQHQWMDFPAHYEKPLEMGTASPWRSKIGRLPGGRTLTSGVEHVLGGLKFSPGPWNLFSSRADELHPGRYKTDRIAMKRATNWGIAIRKNLIKELVAGGMAPAQAEREVAKAMALKFGVAPRIAGRVASDVGYLGRVGRGVGRALLRGRVPV